MELTRAETLALFDLAREEELHESPGFGFRPIIWHLAHIGVFEAYWLLQKLKHEPAPDERYERIFDPINTPREESRGLPTRGEMESYLERVRGRVLKHLEGAELDESEALLLRDGYIYSLVLEHEQQHQETLAYLFQLLGPEKKKAREAARASALTTSTAEPGMALIPAGEFVMGAGSNGFVYDNEGPAHEVYVPEFRLDRLLVTNEEYAQFVAEGGYVRREFWSEEGRAWRERENWEAPLYWRRVDGGRRVQTMFGEESDNARHPVTGVSWYEAEAYARFAGKRLPTEAEWEKAAGWDDDGKQKRRYAWGDEEPTLALCNFDFSYWGTTPVGSFPEGATPEGLLDMTGNVWEWTSSPFAGYPDFKAFPYPEYSEVWFDGDHRVLKGGSWATRRSLLRISFRNFFRRQFRIAFAGIRCAADA